MVQHELNCIWFERVDLIIYNFKTSTLICKKKSFKNAWNTPGVKFHES